jgi:hypothetical protein
MMFSWYVHTSYDMQDVCPHIHIICIMFAYLWVSTYCIIFLMFGWYAHAFDDIYVLVGLFASDRVWSCCLITSNPISLGEKKMDTIFVCASNIVRCICEANQPQSSVIAPRVHSRISCDIL